MVSSDWEDYECLDAGNGEKLERFGKILLRRPDPQAIWNINYNNYWNNIDGQYYRSSKGGGYWQFNKQLPQFWTIKYKELLFKVAPTNFKHMGLFPEQAVNWDYMIAKIKKSGRAIKVLNLFAYTGGATVACLKAGATVVHVDASKGMVNWAKENVSLSQLDDCDVRYIVDDCIKFVEREVRRGNVYDAIIMDPPSYGRGPNGEIWKFEKNVYDLILKCMLILSDNPLFFLINSYTTGISSTVLENILRLTLLVKFPDGQISAGEIGLPVTTNALILPCGIYGRWEDK
ncbi:MAG: class I SAM-dependent methyltransferase [Bacilli bacterium]